MTFDTEANALYYLLRRGSVSRTEKARAKGLEYLLDYDDRNRLVGLEILNLKQALELATGHLSLLLVLQLTGAVRERRS